MDQVNTCLTGYDDAGADHPGRRGGDLRRFEDAAAIADDRAINAYCYAVDCHDPWYFGPTERFGPRLAPSAMVLKELMWLYQTQYDRSRVRGFHQHEDVVFHAPVPAGTELILTGRNTERFTKRGKGYFRHVSEAHGRDGRLNVSQVNTEIIERSRPGVPDDPDTRQGRRPTAGWDEAAAVSDAIPPIPEAGMRLTGGANHGGGNAAGRCGGAGDRLRRRGWRDARGRVQQYRNRSGRGRQGLRQKLICLTNTPLQT